MSDKIIVTAALAGAATTKSNNPNTPYSPEEFAEESYRCMQEGVSIVHIHAKNPQTGFATPDINLIRPTIEAIRARCPGLIVNMSSAISTGLTADQRIAPIIEMKPDMASLNTNTMNFALADHKQGKVLIEFIFENTFKMLEGFGREMKKIGVKPEFEVYDPGGLYNTLLIRKQGDVFVEPLHFQFVYGVAGGMSFNPEIHMSLKHLLPENSTYSVCGVGPNQIQAAFMAAITDGHIRVGLEDNTRVPGGELAKGSWEQVKWVQDVARIVGRQIATPDETREMLGLPKRK